MGSFTVFFDGQFWVGLAVREGASDTAVARVVFGPEPSDAELLEWARERFSALSFRSVEPTGLGEAPRPKSPKRRQRDAQQALQSEAHRTRAQRALSSALEIERGERAKQERTRRQDLANERFAKRSEKRKRARRGK